MGHGSISKHLLECLVVHETRSILRNIQLALLKVFPELPVIRVVLSGSGDAQHRMAGRKQSAGSLFSQEERCTYIVEGEGRKRAAKIRTAEPSEAVCREATEAGFGYPPSLTVAIPMKWWHALHRCYEPESILRCLSEEMLV